MKIYTLMTYFSMKPCDSSHTLPPSVRTFLFTTQGFVERPKFLQVRFQGLRVLDLFTRAKRQIRVFHAEVCPNAFTCCWQRFKIFIGGRYTDPISPATITLDRNLGDSSVPLAVLVKRIRNFIKLPFTRLWIPLTKSQCDTIIGQRPASRTWIRHRLKRTSRLNMRSTTKFLKETVVRFMNTLEFLLHRLAGQSVPVRVCRLFQKFKVITHTLIVYIRKSVFMSLTLPLVEIHMHLPHIVKQVANTDRIRRIIKRIFIGLQGISGIRRLSPNRWEVDTLSSNNACYVYQPDTLIISHL